MDEEEDGILNIEFSDDQVDIVKKKADRTGQTEDEFQIVKENYRVRVENGNVRFILPPCDLVSYTRCSQPSH